MLLVGLLGTRLLPVPRVLLVLVEHHLGELELTDAAGAVGIGAREHDRDVMLAELRCEGLDSETHLKQIVRTVSAWNACALRECTPQRAALRVV